jgi:oligopeptide/dipeptide ABC transporter ATP-binding protein
MDALLEVRDLAVEFRSKQGCPVRVLRGVSFEVHPGEVVGLLGESGCGKTTTAHAILRLLPPEASIASGAIRLAGRNLAALSETAMEEVRGAEITLISQEPSIALNPVLSVGVQIAEVIRAHRRMNRRERRAEVLALLAAVGLTEQERIYAAYPHQLSGGQKQRVVIAQALACRPALVVADEPTAALDTILQAGILNLLKELKERFGLTLLLITHDPAILSGWADRILVMYAGRIVEEGAVRDVLTKPLHPFTKGLLTSVPRSPAMAGASDRKRMATIEGNSPDMGNLSPGCSFAPRCPERMESCTMKSPQTVQVEPTRRVECLLYG